jgi:hypothetical protein
VHLIINSNRTTDQYKSIWVCKWVTCRYINMFSMGCLKIYQVPRIFLVLASFWIFSFTAIVAISKLFWSFWKSLCKFLNKSSQGNVFKGILKMVINEIVKLLIVQLRINIKKWNGKYNLKHESKQIKTKGLHEIRVVNFVSAESGVPIIWEVGWSWRFLFYFFFFNFCAQQDSICFLLIFKSSDLY